MDFILNGNVDDCALEIAENREQSTVRLRERVDLCALHV